MTCLHGESGPHYFGEDGYPNQLCGGGKPLRCDHWSTMLPGGQPLNPLRCTRDMNHLGHHSRAGAASGVKASANVGPTRFEDLDPEGYIGDDGVWVYGPHVYDDGYVPGRKWCGWCDRVAYGTASNSGGDRWPSCGQHGMSGTFSGAEIKAVKPTNLSQGETK